MTKHFTQATRLGAFSCVLGKDTLVLLRFRGDDYLNELYEYSVEVLAETPDIDMNALLGTHASVRLKSAQHGDRFFDGIVTHAAWSGVEENGHSYHLTLKPWFWLAGLRRNQRIFHNMTVRQILKELFADYAAYGDPVYEDKLTSDYRELEYTVQYRETDLDFARRLMERFGITFHFQHRKGNHVMVLTDSVDLHETIPGQSREFRPFTGHHGADDEHFWEWLPERNVTIGAVRLTDYNFKSPTASMETNRVGDAEYAHGQIESYDYPGDYLTQGVGGGVVDLRTLQERGQDVRHRALGDCMTLRAGMRLRLTGDKAPGNDVKDFICLAANHVFEAEAYGSGSSNHGEIGYQGSYVLMPEDRPLAPDRKTRVPIVQGPQTAVVVGKGEVDSDEYGRILVRFHWDLANAYSMRCRVSQNWASKGWGGMIIPRIGMEVVVEFLEGDPDKPLVTGCVYNGRNMPAYDLPANQTKSVFRTDTHKGQGYNELSFEDDNDRELIYMHGQKDHEIEILNDRSKTIGRDQSEAIGQDKSISVGRDHTESVGQDANHNIARDVIYNVGQNQQEKYGKDHIHYVGNIHKQDVFADYLQKVGRNSETTVLGRSVLNVTESITNNTKTHTLMAFQKFVIKGPGGKITIDGSGITLEAAKINLKGSVSMGGGGSAQVPTLKGAANDGLPLVEECLAQKGED